MKSKKRVLLGISSGIAAFKVLELIPLLQKENLDVVVMMTNHASLMIHPREFEKATGNKVHINLYSQNFDYKDVLESRSVDHIDLADSADLTVIIPATANIIGKLANGIADDFVTTTLLAVTTPILLFPSMNVHMWTNQIVTLNIEKLKKYGYTVYDPDSGALACGYEGKGRLPEIKLIAKEIIMKLKERSLLAGKKILVTSGGTAEKIDEVRFITNRSSGKMGIAMAEACQELGAEVVLLRAASAIKSRLFLNEFEFTTSEDLYKLMKREVMSADVVIHAAAVSDFQVKQPIKNKLSSKETHTVELIPQLKIIDQIKKWNPAVQLIAFKAEYGLSEDSLIATARERLKTTAAEAIIANDISRKDAGFGVDTSEVFIVTADKSTHIPFGTKKEIARVLVKKILFDNTY